MLMKDCVQTGDLQCKADAMFRHAIFNSSAGKNFEVAKKEYAECTRIFHQLHQPDHEQRQFASVARKAATACSFGQNLVDNTTARAS